MEKKISKWCKTCIGLIVLILFLIFALVWVVDPYFHFHKPFSFIKYRLYDERYINDGISRHFEFDAIITGTSMTQNFKTSEADEIFGTNSVKESFSGASYYELSQNLERALKRNKNLKTVFWTIDYNAMYRKYDFQSYDSFPTYLYDDNPFNDVEYIYNKDVLYHGVLSDLRRSLSGEEPMTMDEYAIWENYKELGKEYVLANYDKEILIEHDYRKQNNLSRDEIDMVHDNINKNIVELVNRYPDVTFYIFYSPYSICYWDSLKATNTMEIQFEMEQLATELMLECPNIKLYNFFDQYDIITNLDNYRDKEHYGAHINSLILKWLKSDIGLLTKDNYLERLEEEKDYYRAYDYDSIFD